MRVRTFLSLGAAILSSVALAQSGPTKLDPGDWPRYTRDFAGTRYSPLKQITTANVAKLAPAWSFKLRPTGGGAILSGTTPIVIAGTLYIPLGNAVVALEADSGKEIWRHPVATGTARRNVAYWPGDRGHAPRIIYSNGTSLFALDARTGRVESGFGNGGELALGVPFTYAPTVYKNVLIVGA
jgi:glucose dehydrogenase